MYSIQVQSVLYHNKKEDILKSLASLSNAADIFKKDVKNSGEVTVSYGDASKTPIFKAQEIEEFKKSFPGLNIKYTYFDENTGSAKGHNKLAEQNESEFMIIMNPDVIMSPRCIKVLIEPFTRSKMKAGITEARQTPIEHPKSFNKETYETGWATTACAMFRTEDFEKLGGFDAESFFLYCDDVDFSWRMRLLKKKIYYLPDAVIFHAKRLNNDASWKPTNAEVYYSAESALIMAYKWSNRSRSESLYKIFMSSGDENLIKAATHYAELKMNKKLPQPIDPHHKVATFVNDCYAEHRFGL